MAGPGGGPPRKSHIKSRKGCKTCKRRHIRCDETFPQCVHPTDFLPKVRPKTTVSDSTDLWLPRSLLPETPFLPHPEPMPVFLEQLLNAAAKKTTVPVLPDGGIGRPTTSERGRSYLPVFSGGRVVHALPDTGAGRNIMSLEYALQTGLSIDISTSKRCKFRNAAGGRFQAMGETTADIAFMDRPSAPQNVVFSVVEKCSAPFVFGREFLRDTLCLSQFKHRFIKGARGLAQQIFRVMHTEAPDQRLKCQLDSQSVLANADTGSDVDLISLEYAISRGWWIDRQISERGRVILSDGAVMHLEGSVTKNLAVGGESLATKFYVLDGLTCDALLGDDTLDTLDVWNNHVDEFVDIEHQEILDFYNIEWLECFNEVEREVDAIVNGTPLPMVPTHGQRLASLFGRESSSFLARLRLGGKKSKSEINKGELMRRELWQRLYEIDTIEAHQARLVSERIAAATGDARRDAENEDDRRKQRWRDLRNKITDLHARVQPDGSIAELSSA